MELRELDDQEFRNLFAKYQTIELELYNIKNSLDAVKSLTTRLRLCKVGEIENDVTAFGELDRVSATIAELDARVSHTKATLVAETNARYSKR